MPFSPSASAVWVAAAATITAAVGVAVPASPTAPAAASTNRWLHGWDTTAASTFADFRSPTLLTDAQVEFAASKYRVISLEKCSGIDNGTKTEEYIYSTAQRLKAADPTVKVVFYLNTQQYGFTCYASQATLLANPAWWLRDDFGNVINAGTQGCPTLDPTNPEARAFWAGIPLGGDNGTGMFRGTPVAELIDGVLADGAGYHPHANISTAREENLTDATHAMLGELQAKFTQANGGIVMANGISIYGGANADPRFPDNHNLEVLSVANAIMNEHTAAFESVDANNASLKVETVARDLDAIVAAATAHNGSKVVFMQTWPGLYAGVQKYPPVGDGGEPTPTTNAEWRDALRSHFFFAHALYLTVAAPNVYWFYGGTWYDSGTGYLACPEDPSSCPAPPEWYPDLDKPLGAPLGPRALVAPYVWERQFEHASVRLDLNHWNASAVTFK